MSTVFKGAAPTSSVADWLCRAPCVPLFCAFASGIAIGTAFAPGIWVLGVLTAVSACATLRGALYPSTDQFYRWFWPLALLACLGALRAHSATPRGADLPLTVLDGQTVVLEGVIDDEPVLRPDVVVARLRLNWVRRVSGPGESGGQTAVVSDGQHLLVKLDPSIRRWRYGDVLRLEGPVSRPPRIDAFDYRLYLARKGIAVWMPQPAFVAPVAHAPPSEFWARAFALKDALRLAIERCVPAPESALLNGILIGDDNALPTGLVEDFRRTGTSHIISISGFNVGVIVGALVLLLGRFMHPRRFALPLILLLWAYALFVGASASVVRAVAMASVALFGQLIWRRGLTLNTLAAAALAMLAAQPFYLFDIGFQLSAAATLGLVLFADRLSALGVISGSSDPRIAPIGPRDEHSRPHRGGFYAIARRVQMAFHLMRRLFMHLWRLLLDGVLLTTAAQLAAMPLMLVHFGSVSLVTLLSNALVLPLQPPIMALGAVAGLVGVFDTDSGRIAALPVYALLRASTALISWTAGWTWASVPVPAIGWGGALVYCLGLGAAWLLLRRVRAGWRPDALLFKRAIAALILLAPVLGLVWVWHRPDERMHLVLRGSSAYIRFPDGARLAFAGEGDLSGAILADVPFWDRRIDVLVIPQLTPRAQAQALQVLQSVSVQTVLIPDAATPQDTLWQFWRAPPYRASVVRAGDHLVLGAAQLEIQQLAADRLDNAVLGLRVVSGSQHALLWQAGAVNDTTLSQAGPLKDIDLVVMQRGQTAVFGLWPSETWVISTPGHGPVSNTGHHKDRHIDLESVSSIKAISFTENFIIYVVQSIDKVTS
jgi:competence protein ComEC